MRKRMSRKADQTIWFLVGLALAIMVLVVVGLGFSKGWGYIFGKIGILPGDLEAAAQSCKVSATQDLETSYCYEFKKITLEGKSQYMNCKTLENYATFDKLSTACDLTILTNSEKLFCNTLKDTDLVNGKACWKEQPAGTQVGFGCSKDHVCALA